MTADFRAMCAELVATLAERIDDKGDAGPYFAHAALLLNRARAALAEPGPEEPTDEDLWNTADLIFQANSWPTDAIRYARAVLARWGNHVPDATKMVSPAPAAEGEVAELAAWLRDDLELYPAEKRRAADLLERQAAPVPVAAAGLCELADDLREQASQGYCEFISREDLRRVADVLEQLAVSAHKQEPAVGPPSDDELLELAQHHSVSYTMSDGSVVYPLQHGCDMRDDVLSFARAVLARWGNLPESPDSSDEPAVPKGREPASVIEQPTVMQIIELSDEIEAAGLGQVDFARAVLARWGNPAPQLPDTND